MDTFYSVLLFLFFLLPLPLLLPCKGRGGRSCCSTLYYLPGRWCCSSHGALKSLTAYLVIIIQRWPGFSTAARQQLQCKHGDLVSPSPPGALDRAGSQGAASAAVSAPAAGAELSTHSALCSWRGWTRLRAEDTQEIYLPPGRTEATYFRMASKYTGLFILFHLLALNVVSQISAFPTPTASSDGE